MSGAKQIPKGNKVRYAVVAAGWISQAAFMPGVLQTSNSEMTVVITSDPEKGEKLAKEYNLTSYSYDDFPRALKEGLFDALYIATPNWKHKEYTVPALEAGYHVLLEKPMEDTLEDCQAIIEAQKKSGAKLMIAYRLHFEPGTVDLINRVRQGALGDPRFFNASFCQLLKETNHRAKNGFSAGPVPDIGTYCINAARNIFGLEPIEVFAHGFKAPGVNMNFHDTVSVTLKFPGERIATFVISYTAMGINRFDIVGTEGDIHCNPAFMFGKGESIEYTSTIKGEKKTHTFPSTDQFAGETEYFSKCVLDGVDPEPDGDEGIRDIRVIIAIKNALETGQPQKLEPLESRRHPVPEQVYKISYGKEVKNEDMINADTPAKGM